MWQVTDSAASGNRSRQDVPDNDHAWNAASASEVCGADEPSCVVISSRDQLPFIQPQMQYTAPRAA